MQLNLDVSGQRFLALDAFLDSPYDQNVSLNPRQPPTKNTFVRP